MGREGRKKGIGEERGKPVVVARGGEEGRESHDLRGRLYPSILPTPTIA